MLMSTSSSISTFRTHLLYFFLLFLNLRLCKCALGEQDSFFVLVGLNFCVSVKDGRLKIVGGSETTVSFLCLVVFAGQTSLSRNEQYINFCEIGTALCLLNRITSIKIH